MTDKIHVSSGRRKRPYIMVDNELIRSPELTINEKVLYMLLDTYADRGRECFPGLKVLAKLLNVDTRTVQRILKSLVEKKMITKTARFNTKGVQISNLYELEDLPEEYTMEYVLEQKKSPTAEKSELTIDDTMGSNQYEKYRKILADQIEYEHLLSIYPLDKTIITEILDIAIDYLMATDEKLRIGQQIKDQSIVKSTYSKLRRYHIEYVLDNWKNHTEKVINPRSYIAAMLYNSVQSMNLDMMNHVKTT